MTFAKNVSNHACPRGLHAIAGLLIAGALVVCGCKSGNDAGAYDAANLGDCLPAFTFTNQHGAQLSLASLKGKPVLVDFIYTACPGACLMLTQKMARIAAGLAPQLGTGVTLVSITIDPEHDGPSQLAAYARKQGAEGANWLFLTGSPANVDKELAVFALRRERKPDGSVDHVTGIFLLGVDGREVHEYEGEIVKVSTVIADVKKIVNPEPG
jgi:cytochrome oxidase Cu insertion factor (SCO1/SenC/PrrC family)